TDEGPAGAFRSAMQSTGNQLFTGSGLAQNEDGGIGSCNFLYLLQHLPHGLARTDNFLKHRRAIDFLSQHKILVAQLIFHLPTIIDIGCGHVPADDLALFIFERVVVKELPAISRVPESAHFHLERSATREPLLTLASGTL